MHVKASNPVDTLPAAEIHPLIQAYFEFNHLKQLYRQGWLRRGIPDQRCESVAEHTFAVAVLGLLLCDSAFPKLNSQRVLRMALLHDFGEIYTGDIIPSDPISLEEKHQLEQEAIQQVLGELPGAEDYLALWGEFESGETPEAQLVRQLDRLEMALQASVYEHQGMGDLSEFYATARAALSDPGLRQILDELEHLRT